MQLKDSIEFNGKKQQTEDSLNQLRDAQVTSLKCKNLTPPQKTDLIKFLVKVTTLKLL